MSIAIFPHDNSVSINLNEHPISDTFKNRIESEALFRKLNTYLINNNIIRNNVIDLGAWIGDNAIPWAKNLPQSIIYAIDPSIDNCNFINDVCKWNMITNVKTINKAISNDVEELSTNEDLYHCSFVFNNPGTSGINKLSSVSLDQLHDCDEITKIGYIHVDVEGMEYKVLNGAIKIIQLYKPIITFEQHIEKENYHPIVSFLQNLGYFVFLINEKLPGCWHDCRNFIAFPNHLYSETLRVNIENEFSKNFIVPIKNISVAYVTGYIGNDPSTNLPQISPHVDSYFITNNSLVAKEAETKYTHVVLLEDIKNDEMDPVESEIINSMHSKPLKVFPEKFLKKSYDFIVWYDNKFDVNLSDTITFIYSWDYDKSLSLHKHIFAKNIVDEFNAAMHQLRYKRQIDNYYTYINTCKEKGLTENYHKHSQTGFIIYNNHHEKTKEIKDAWMSHIKQCGIECQISFNMVRQLYEEYIEDFSYPYTLSYSLSI